MRNVLPVFMVLQIVLLVPGGCSKKAELDHIILITIDTLRADHLGMYGYIRPTSPFLDSLAADGQQFMNAIAASSHTVPSHASIFTSLQASQHGAVLNGTTLNEAFLTMAEVFQKKGFQTAGFVGVSFLASLRQGFQHFDAPPAERHWTHRPAAQTVDRILTWLEGKKNSEKTFLWVHFYDPHEHAHKAQSQIPPLHLKRFSGQYAGLPEFLNDKCGVDPAVARNPTFLQEIDRYDAQIYTVDREIERLFQQARKLNHNALWIITSDHGEGLRSHDYMGHGKAIYQEQLRVPLLFYFSDKRFSLSKISTTAAHVDILPTIAELFQFSLKEQMIPIEGTSRVLDLHGKKSASTLLYAQRKGEEKDARDVREHGAMYSLQDSNHKLMIHTAGKEEFFDLIQDPHETRDCMVHPAERERFRKELTQRYQRFLQQASSAGVQDPSINPEYIEELKALGYLN